MNGYSIPLPYKVTPREVFNMSSLIRRTEKRLHLTAILGTLVLLLATTSKANAANVLFVDDGNDNETPIITVLEGDGHTVTVAREDWVLGENQVLQGNLSGYDAIVWSANNQGGATSATTINSLQTYVSSGGSLFVTGSDSLASPEDPLLANFIANYTGPNPAIGFQDHEDVGPITVSNHLTTGVINLVGLTPAELDDQDSLNAPEFGPDVTAVSCNGNGCSWIYRTLGNGVIAYVSSDDGNWTSTVPSQDYFAYNAAVRNFVSNATGPISTEQPSSIPTTPVYALILIAFGLLLTVTRRLRTLVKRA